jgi:hypothetical protein
VRLAADDHLVQTLATQCANQTFRNTILPSEHLRPTDAPLLASYVQATIASRRSARDPSKVDVWEKATRLQAMLATKLRLTAQSRTDSRTVGRQEPPGPHPWD